MAQSQGYSPNYRKSYICTAGDYVRCVRAALHACSVLTAKRLRE